MVFLKDLLHNQPQQLLYASKLPVINYLPNKRARFQAIQQFEHYDSFPVPSERISRSSNEMK